MSVDAAAILSQVSGLLGALIGGGASLAVAVYNQRSEERLQRVANEVTKRETIYADFLVSASKLLLNAYTHDEIVLGGDEQHLIGLINRMRLFAPPHIVGEAEAVLKAIVEILLKPSIELRQLARESLVQESRSRSLPEVQPELPGRPGACAPHLEVKPRNEPEGPVLALLLPRHTGEGREGESLRGGFEHSDVMISSRHPPRLGPSPSLPPPYDGGGEQRAGVAKPPLCVT